MSQKGNWRSWILIAAVGLTQGLFAGQKAPVPVDLVAEGASAGVELWHCVASGRTVDIKVAVPAVDLAAYDSQSPQSPVGLTIAESSDPESLNYIDSRSQGAAFNLLILRAEPVGVDGAGKNIYAAKLNSQGQSSIDLQCTNARE